MLVEFVLSSLTDGWKYTKMMVIKTEHKIKASYSSPGILAA